MISRSSPFYFFWILIGPMSDSCPPCDASLRARARDPEVARRRDDPAAPHPVEGASCATGMPEMLLGPELAACSVWKMISFAGVLKRAANRLVWRNMNAARCATISRAIRLSERALGKQYAGRKKTTAGWVLHVRVANELIPVILVRTPRLHCFNEAPGATEVIVLRPTAVDAERLGKLLSEQHPRRKRARSGQ
jgi:hypothetical protein